MTKFCSYGMEVLGVCHGWVVPLQNAEVFIPVLGTTRLCVYIEGEG